MQFASSFTKLLVALVFIDFFTGLLGDWAGFEYLAPDAEKLANLWLPVMAFTAATWTGFVCTTSGLRPAYRGPLLNTVERLGDSPIIALVVLTLPIGFSVGNPIIATLQGVSYGDLIGNVQGSGPLMVIFGLVAMLSSLRLMQLLLSRNIISWKRAFIITAATLWVFGPRKAALFSALAPIAIYLWLNHKSTRKTKFKMALLAVIALITAPLVDILRYGDEAEFSQFVIQLAGGLAPISSVAPQTLAYTLDSHCTPNPGAVLGNLYYFVPRALWPDKPAILPNSNFLVTTEVLGLKDTLSISGSLLSENLLLSCSTNPVITTFIMLLEGVIIGLFAGGVLRIFFGALGFWTILVPLLFAMFREGIGLYIKDILTNMVLLLFIHIMVTSLAPARKKNRMLDSGASRTAHPA